MKNQKLLTIAALAGITIGGLSIGSASAQGYGGQGDDPVAQTSVAVEAADTVDATNPVSRVRTLQIQDTTTPDADAEADSNVDGEREGRRGGHRGGCSLEAAAEAIGIDEADLKAAVEAGDSIADVAVANGVPVESVIDAMVAEKAEKIDAKVEAGRITEAEADEKLAQTEAKITDRVNGSDDSSEL